MANLSGAVGIRSDPAKTAKPIWRIFDEDERYPFRNYGLVNG